MPSIIPQSNAQLTLFSLTKICTDCKADKPHSEFYKNKNSLTGRCKVCHVAYGTAKYFANHEVNKAASRDKANAKYQEDPEKFKARAKAYRAADPEKAREHDRAYEATRKDKRQAYRKANAERRKAYQRVYNKANRERRLAYNREYYQKNTEVIKARSKASILANPKANADIHRRWKKANPEACRASQRRRYYARWQHCRDLDNIRTHARRVIIKTDRGNYTPAEWQAIKERQGFRCLMCGKQEPEIKLTVDHVIPVSKGGLNTADNLAGLCKPCNSKKGTKTLDLRPK